MNSVKKIRHIEWFCQGCSKACVNITPEARCLCGHRYREHDSVSKSIKCKLSNCKCDNFFYIYGQGAFLLRCRCKHKANEHDPKTRKCIKTPSCQNQCKGFDSPFVCNCNCGWAKHIQREVTLQPKTFQDITKIELGQLEDDVGNFSGISRGE